MPPIVFRARPINAHAESVATTPMFRNASARRHCLVPADALINEEENHTTEMEIDGQKADKLLKLVSAHISLPGAAF